MPMTMTLWNSQQQTVLRDESAVHRNNEINNAKIAELFATIVSKEGNHLDGTAPRRCEVLDGVGESLASQEDRESWNLEVIQQPETTQAHYQCLRLMDGSSQTSGDGMKICRKSGCRVKEGMEEIGRSDVALLDLQGFVELLARVVLGLPAGRLVVLQSCSLMDRWSCSAGLGTAECGVWSTEAQCPYWFPVSANPCNVNVICTSYGHFVVNILLDASSNTSISFLPVGVDAVSLSSRDSTQNFMIQIWLRPKDGPTFTQPRSFLLQPKRMAATARKA
jgi:hypothetical protein